MNKDALALIALGFRTVSGGKGSDTANKQREQELQMQQQAFNTQQQQLSLLNNAFGKYLPGNIGYSPQMLASMRAQFLNQNTGAFNQAGNQVRASLGARGEGLGNNPVGGTYGTGIANLMAAQAGSQSQGLLGINVSNAQQALQNQFNAGNILSGNAATLTGTQGVAGSAASNALNAYIQAANQGFTNAFTTGLGGSLGRTLGSFGSSSGPSGTFSSWGTGCWIAEAIWGVYDPRTLLVRFWLNFDFGKRWYGRPVMRLYLKYGQSISNKPWAVRLLKPLFNLALRKSI